MDSYLSEHVAHPTMSATVTYALIAITMLVLALVGVAAVRLTRDVLSGEEGEREPRHGAA